MYTSNEVYNVFYDTVKKLLHVSDNQLNSVMKMDVYTAIDKVEVRARAFAAIHKGHMSKTNKKVNPDLRIGVSYLCAYAKAVHLCIPEIPASMEFEFKDLCDLHVLDKNLLIDFTYNGKPMCMWVSKDIAPLTHSSEDFTHIVMVFAGTKVIGTFTFMYKADFLFMSSDLMSCCGNCELCRRERFTNTAPVYFMHHNTEGCLCEQRMPQPYTLLGVIASVSKMLLSEPEIVEKAVSNERKGTIHKAHEDCSDYYVTLPYSKVYKYTDRKEWQGGHHRSPVAHDRRSHYRRCRGGSYIYRGNDYVFVGKGIGTHCKVRATRVNDKNSNLKRYVVTEMK